MFIVEVDFGDGEGNSELVLLKRSYARIGPSETSHLIIDGVEEFPCDILVAKSLGRRFRCTPVKHNFLDNDGQFDWSGEYDGSTDVVIGDITISITSVDPNIGEYLLSQESSSLREDLNCCHDTNTSLLPALHLVGEIGLGLSIANINSCMIGRSRTCLFRLEHPMISQEEALITRTNDQYYLEADKSAKRVSINGRVLNSKRALHGGDRITLQPKVEIVYIHDEQDLEDIIEELGVSPVSLSPIEPVKYLRCLAGDSHPGTLPLKAGQTITIGRDPFHPVWVNAPFVSRSHVEIKILHDGYEIVDHSSNGTKVNNVKLLNDEPQIFNEDFIEITLGTSIRFLISSLNENDFNVWQNNNYKAKLVNQDNLNFENGKELGSLLEESLNDEKKQKKNTSQNDFKSLVKNLDLEQEQSKEEHHRTFVEFQKKTLREQKESPELRLDPSLTQSMEEYSYEIEPNTGLSKVLIFIISIIILLVSGIFIFIGKHLIH